MVEPLLFQHHYAYRRSRGTERHLASLVNPTRRSLLRGHYVYTISFDVARVFDRESQYPLAQTLIDHGVDTSHNARPGTIFSTQILHSWNLLWGDAEISTGISLGGVLFPFQRLMCLNDIHRRLRVMATAEAARVDEVCATLVALAASGVATVCSGYVNGRGASEEAPASSREAALLYGLRLLRESVLSIDQRSLDHLTLSAGDALVYRRIDRWMRFGTCTLRSSAASGILGDIIAMRTWLNTDVAYAPHCLPGNFGKGGGVDSDLTRYVRFAEHFRYPVFLSGRSTCGARSSR